MFWFTNVRRQQQMGLLEKFAPSPSLGILYRKSLERHLLNSKYNPYRRGTLADPTCMSREKALQEMHANCFLLVPLMPLCVPATRSSSNAGFKDPSLLHVLRQNFSSHGFWGSNFYALLQSWKEFLELQSNQSIEFNRDFPVDDRLYGNLKKCGKRLHQQTSTSAESLSPSSIQIYAEVGHLSVFCAGQTATTYLQADNHTSSLNLSHIAHTFKSSCLESLHTKSKKPSLPKMLSLMGAQLEVFESNIRHSNLQAWTRHIVRMINHASKHNSHNKWKLILLAPALFDIKPGESTQKLAQDTMQSLQIIQHKLPTKTVVLLIRNSRMAFWQVLSGRLVFAKRC
uniref:Uncharacterized protein n=1 Tax=Ditylenchus dipsaci TaxID=166011 RepID=A0A915EMP3_9BILA